jgi:non-specific serine/threonine protein kinase
VGDLAASVGDFARAKVAYQQCLDVAREFNNPIQENLQYLNLGDMAKVEGDYEQAATLYRRSLLWYMEIGDNVGALSILTAMGGLIARRGQPERAARLMGASEALLEEIGVLIQLVEQILYDRDVTFVRGQLGDERFNLLRAEGEAEDYALAELRA